MLRNVREVTLPKARAAILESLRRLAANQRDRSELANMRKAAMATYRHPHLIRGTVHTPLGAFAVVRGVVDLPDGVGERLGWGRITELSSPQSLAGRSLPIASTAMPPFNPVERIP